jgi:hypothetical protein
MNRCKRCYADAWEMQAVRTPNGTRIMAVCRECQKRDREALMKKLRDAGLIP